MSPGTANLGILPPQRSKDRRSIRQPGVFVRACDDSQGCQVSFCNSRTGISAVFYCVTRRRVSARLTRSEQKSLRKVIRPLMTLTNRHPRTLPFAFILIVLLLFFLSQVDAVAKKRSAEQSLQHGTLPRAEKSRKFLHENVACRTNQRLSAKAHARRKLELDGRLSRRELKRSAQSAREQAASLKAIERRRGRPLNQARAYRRAASQWAHNVVAKFLQPAVVPKLRVEQRLLASARSTKPCAMKFRG